MVRSLLSSGEIWACACRGVRARRDIGTRPDIRARVRLVGTVLVLAGALTFASAPAAFAHAQLLGTSPRTGSTVAKQPAEVIFEFNQAVGGTLGAVRVYDAQGNQVDDLDVTHPAGHQHWMGVGLEPNLPDEIGRAHV